MRRSSSTWLTASSVTAKGSCPLLPLLLIPQGGEVAQQRSQPARVVAGAAAAGATATHGAAAAGSDEHVSRGRCQVGRQCILPLGLLVLLLVLLLGWLLRVR